MDKLLLLEDIEMAELDLTLDVELASDKELDIEMVDTTLEELRLELEEEVLEEAGLELLDTTTLKLDEATDTVELELGVLLFPVVALPPPQAESDKIKVEIKTDLRLCIGYISSNYLKFGDTIKVLCSEKLRFRQFA